MGHFPGIACWRHTSGVTASSSLNIIMIKLALTLVSLVATIYAQDAPETPLWFLETSLDGPFRERSAACPPLLESRQDEASFGPIFIPEDQEAPAPTSAVSSSPPSRTPLPPPSNPHGSRPATAAAPALTPPSMDQLCSEERTWTPRVFACSLMMEVTSSDKDFSPTAADPAASSTVKLRRASKH